MDATSDAPEALRPGRFYGAVGGRREAGMVTLSLVEHAAPRQVPLHQHEHMFFSVLLHGGYREWVGDRCIEHAPLTAVFHPERLVHRDEITVAGSRFFIVEVDPALLDERDRAQAELRSVHELGGGPLLWSLFRLLPALARTDADTMEFEETVAEVIDELLAPVAGPAGAPPWLAEVEHTLREDFRAPMSMRTLAARTGLHPAHVARVFRRQHGCTMRRWLHRFRVLHASRLIEQGTPLAQAALDSGFCDQSHLAHVFRDVTGMSPTECRRLLRGDEAPTGEG